MANRFPLIFNSGAGQIQELAASDNLDLTSSNLVNAGILFTSSGSVTAPSLQIGSGTTYNPGLYSPGTDQVAVATNGTGRLFIDASGNMGLGTSPFSGLIDAKQSSSGANVAFRFRNTATTAGSTTTIDLSEDAAGRSVWRYSPNTGDTFFGSVDAGNYNLRLYTNANERARIRNDGTFEIKGAGTAGTSPGFSVNPSTPANSFVIDSSGRLGIGTTPAAGSLLHINSAASTDCKQQISVTTATQAAYTAYVSTVVSTVGTENSTGGSLMSGSGPYATVISNGGAYPINFGTNNTIRATIDSSGRLLVGTSSARSSATQTWLSQIEAVSGMNAPTVGLSIVRNQADIYGGYLSFAKTRGTSNGATTIVTSGDELGGIFFSGADGSTLNSVGASIVAAVDGTPGANDMPGRLVFSTTVDGGSSPTGRAMIDNRGVLHAFVAAGGDGHLFMTGENAGTTYYLFAGFRNATSVAGASASMVFQVFTNGNTQNTNNSYAGISDLKLKENIVDATSQWDDLKALQVRKYNFKEETGHQTHTQIGLVAQEAELVSPGLVYETPDRDAEGNDLSTVTKSVNYSVLYMKAVKALQEAMERIETLEQRLTAAGID